MSMSKDDAASRVIPIWKTCAATQRYGAVWAEPNEAQGFVWVHGPTAAGVCADVLGFVLPPGAIGELTPVTLAPDNWSQPSMALGELLPFTTTTVGELAPPFTI